MLNNRNSKTTNLTNAHFTFDGNSITSFGYPTNVIALLPTGLGITMTNLGVSGQQSSDLITRQAATDASFRASASHNILVVCEILNSLQLGKTPRQAVDDYWTYCDARVAFGWKVVGWTGLPFSWIPNNNVTRKQVPVQLLEANILVRKEWKLHLHKLVDSRKIPQWDVQEAPPTVGFVDGVHPDATGKDLMAMRLSAALRSVPLTLDSEY